MSRITTNLARISAALLLTVFLPGMALAVTANWTGGSGDYSDISNWDVANVPCNDGPVSYDVIFPDGTRTVTMDVASCNVATLFLGDNVTLVIPAGNEFTSSGQADLYGIVDDDGGGFTASVASFPGNRARAYSSSTGQVQIGAATYSSVGLTGAGQVLLAGR